MGEAAAYNVFVTGDFDLRTDVEGKAAAGGHATLQGFAIAEHQPGANALVTGSLTASNGQVYGDGWYATSQSTSSVNFLGGTLQQGAPLDFAGTAATLSALSGTLAALTPNAVPIVQNYGSNVIFLNGSDPFVNVFELDGSYLSSLAAIRVTVPAGSTTIVNVSGATLQAAQAGFDLFGTVPEAVLWNFPDAVSLTISGIGWKGSILAPGAYVELNNGFLDGSVFAASAGGSGQWHDHLFTGALLCPQPECGDGFLDPGEECDDGNVADNDGCSGACDIEDCGDGVQQPGEACDDGNDQSGDGCSNVCVPETCGDGVLQPGLGEQCDDGNVEDEDGCDASCQIDEPCLATGAAESYSVIQYGGNGAHAFVFAGYPGGALRLWLSSAWFDIDAITGDARFHGTAYNRNNAAETYTFDLDFTYRGEGPAGEGTGGPKRERPNIQTPGFTDTWRYYDMVEPGIVTRDSDGAYFELIQFPLGSVYPMQVGTTANNKNPDFGASSWYQWTLFDASGGVIDDGGGDINVSMELVYECLCGDALVSAGEQCDDGNLDNGDGCSDVCEIEPTCGDNYVDPGEQCDDGNLVDGDGCDGACQLEPFCGDGLLDAGEACDDGNNDDFDGCSATCDLEADCGNGLLEVGEQCDDGNLVDGDGCSSVCEVEQCVDSLGIAGDFNVFVFDDFLNGPDVEGKVAAGDQLITSAFSIGFVDAGGVAVVAHDIVLNAGTVYGDAIYSGSFSATSVSFLAGGAPMPGSPIDFAAEQASLTAVSASIDALPTNGLTQTGVYNGFNLVNFDGSDPLLNVFRVDAADLAVARAIRIVTPPNSTVVINVDGGSVLASNLGFRLLATDRQDILWNAFGATEVSLSGLSWQGSVLAPFADVLIDNGNIEGNVIAMSAGGTGQFHWYPFTGSVECP